MGTDFGQSVFKQFGTEAGDLGAIATEGDGIAWEWLGNVYPLNSC